ncbi:MAG: tetratricopeptide repeat protein [Candidatus Loosdrechtia sp.]|uniref:tetratricopeptide repeat protein n=1 Tax=Candidatus Loosdrechtia sp. TaxID=3101272 RepID=UPI003A6A1ABE|nr:MAG: tetratricopeptide repeat protein [Candidatus Jettenia sp. AMX2]
MNESIFNLLRILDKYKIFISIGAGITIAAIAGFFSYRTINERKTEAAWQSLWRVNNDLTTAIERMGKEGKEREAALSTAADAYQYIIDTASSTSAAPWALFQRGIVYYNLKNYDDAIRSYNDFLNKYGSHPIAPLVRQSLGYAYEEKGLLPEAIQQFERVAGYNNFLAAQARLDSGRCYENLGQTSDAIRSYTKIGELFPASNWAVMAQDRLSVIR